MSASLPRALENLVQSGPLIRDASVARNLEVFASLLGPAWRGLVLQQAKAAPFTRMPAGHQTHFDWKYERNQPEMRRLYEAAKTSQWNATTDLDWSKSVDPFSLDTPLVPDDFIPVSTLPIWRQHTEEVRAQHRHHLVAWMLSQFLHGEQGALYAAAQVTEAVPWMDAKLYGSTQVVDEGRHVEAFYTYLTQKLEKRYEINDNLYVIVDALMTDSRWDVKFLGMQIMIEGLALGAFGMLRQLTREPLLKQMLTYVIADEARHVHYGVLALQQYLSQLTDKERREREDWTFEVALLMRNRFFALEFWEEHYAAHLSRAEWEKLVLGSKMMDLFRSTMFKRIIPNLKRIGLLSDRIRPKYDELGLLAFEHLPAAPELTAKDLLEG